MMIEQQSTAQLHQSPSGAIGGAAAPSNKAATLQRLRELKVRVAVASILGFGILSGLVASHSAGATTSATPPATPPDVAVPDPNSPNVSPPDTSQPNANNLGSDGQQNQDQGGWFNQNGSNNQGYAFGSGNSPSQPMAGSGVS